MKRDTSGEYGHINQAMVISTGLPFTAILLLMCWAILRGLMAERK